MWWPRSGTWPRRTHRSSLARSRTSTAAGCAGGDPLTQAAGRRPERALMLGGEAGLDLRRRRDQGDHPLATAEPRPRWLTGAGRRSQPGEVRPVPLHAGRQALLLRGQGAGELALVQVEQVLKLRGMRRAVGEPADRRQEALGRMLVVELVGERR